MKIKEYNFANAKRGAVVKTLSNKTRITIRIDADLLNWFREQVHKAGGGNYQTLMNEALREYTQQKNGVLATTLRKVLREELQIGSSSSLKSPAKRKTAARPAVPA